MDKPIDSCMHFTKNVTTPELLDFFKENEIQPLLYRPVEPLTVYNVPVYIIG
mgnify:CR=1 FL=1